MADLRLRIPPTTVGYDVQHLLEAAGCQGTVLPPRAIYLSVMAGYRDLTDLQLAILGVLWERGECAIGQVHAALRGHRKVSRKTVATLLSRLEQRGMVRHWREGKESVYEATVPRRTVLVKRMAALLGVLFDTSTGAVTPHALDRSDVRAGDVARLRKLLRKAERDLGDKA
jgi:predicted transcriptional regulator